MLRAIVHHSIYAQQNLVSASVAVLGLSFALGLGKSLCVGGWDLCYLRNDLHRGLGADVGIGYGIYDGRVCCANRAECSQSDTDGILAKAAYVVFDDSTLVEDLTFSFTLVLYVVTTTG